LTLRIGRSVLGTSIKDHGKFRKRDGCIPKTWKSKHLSKLLLETNWNLEPVHTPTKEGEIRHSKEEEDKQVQYLLKLWKMSSGTQPWSNTDGLKEAAEKLKIHERKKQEGGAARNMKEEILETKVKERVGNRVRNRKRLVIYGLTFHFKVGPSRHVLWFFLIE